MGYWFRLKAECKGTLPLYLTEYNVMETLGEWRFGSTGSLPRHWMDVSGEAYAPDQDRTVHQVGVWMGLRDSSDIS
jgi:hypothetical protein